MTPTFRQNSVILAQTQCPRCGTATLTGLDDPFHAMPATLDPITYDKDQAIGICMTGRYTYRIKKTVGARWQIVSNRYWLTPAHAALPTTQWDHADGYAPQHVCGKTIPGGHPIRFPTIQGGTDLFTAAQEPPGPFDGPPPF